MTSKGKRLKNSFDTFPFLPMLTKTTDITNSRTRILASLAKEFKCVATTLWLLDDLETSACMRLAYIFPKPNNSKRKQLSTVFFPIDEEGISLTTGNDVPEKWQSYIAKALSFESLEGSISICLSLLSITHANDPNSTSSYELLGILTLHFPEDEALEEDDLQSLNIYRVLLSQSIEQGRQARALHASMEISEALQAHSDTSRMIENVCRSLKKLLPARIVVPSSLVACRESTTSQKRYNKSRDAMAELVKSINGNQTLSKSEEPVRYSGTYLQRLLKKKAPDKLKSLLAIPIALRCHSLVEIDFHAFREIKSCLPIERRQTHLLLCLNKQDSIYLPRAFSVTDLLIAKTTAFQLENVLPGALSYDLQLGIESAALHFGADPYNVTEFLEVFIPDHFPHIEDVTIYQIREYEGNFTASDLLPKKINATDIRILKKFFNQSVHEREASAEELSEKLTFSVSLPQSGSPTIIVNLETALVPHRVMMIRLSSNSIPEWELSGLVQLLGEAHLQYRNLDNMRARDETMAQIRHAVVGPTSAARRYLGQVLRSVALAKRPGSDWSSLRNDQSFTEAIRQAYYNSNAAFSMVETGRYLLNQLEAKNLKLNRYTVSGTLREVRAAVTGPLRDRNLTWDMRIKGDANGAFIGDTLLVWLLLFNLIDNAIKYSYRDRTLTVAVEVQEEKWRFAVTDFGVYLPDTDREKVFTPFFRARTDDRMNRRPGTGLGLPLCLSILKAHDPNAYLDFKSERLPGAPMEAETTFFFEMNRYVSQNL